jgi:hypothetical protein
MNSVLKVVESELKLLILWWVVECDKYKTALVSDPRHRIAVVDFLRPECPHCRHRIALVDFLRPESPVVTGSHSLIFSCLKSTSAIR